MKGSVITALMLMGALATGGAAAFFANGYIDKSVAQRRSELDAQYEPVRAIVANTDLQVGTFISPDTVAIRSVPKAFLHSEAVLADDFSAISGRMLTHAVKGGEAVLLSHLAQEAGAGFSSQLQAGQRALTFPVDDESSISGMLAPGDRIDIFFTTSNNNENLTMPLLYDVPVIATGIRTRTNASYLDEKQPTNQYQTITVSVAPEDAAKITLAQDVGKITVALRQPQDGNPIQVARLTKTALLQGPRTITRSAPRLPIEIILGGR
ncbi:MAG TPA: Flp pilus assembly protein CpaB [Steroidobacteraceae bacterium]|nr:Flp pilus assembly protein CpaB [Steroidobacteraceae bacterium]